ncbi:MAG: hypothetical protein EZS28_051441, partial [Streblomastix strix]
IPPQDSASGAVGTTNYYARNDHSHPINVETNASNIPIVNGVGANGTSAFYARQDHVHPQQLTYDGNVTATKFIKTGGTSNDILLADGSTKQSMLAGRSFTVIDPEQYVKLCTFIAVNSTTDNSIKFEVSTRTGFGQLQFNQHWTNGQGISEYQYKFIPSLASGINNAWILYFNAGVDRYGELCYDDGLRIGRPDSDGLSSVFLGCSTSTTGLTEGQWAICTPNSGSITVNDLPANIDYLVDPSANNISFDVPPVLMNLVAVTFPS